MLAKIFFNNHGYEVSLLTAEEVVEEIKSEFISEDGCKEILKDKTNLDDFISQYIDYYEKIEYSGAEYFILKSRIPVFFNKKSNSKKFIPSEEMVGRVIGSLTLPVAFIVVNFFTGVINFKNYILTSMGLPVKINTKYSYSEGIIFSIAMLALNILFWIFYFSTTMNILELFGTQVVNFILGVLKPIKYHYCEIENFKLTNYTFDEKYDQLSSSPLDKLKSMKVTIEKQEIDFNFNEDNQIKTKQM